MRFVIVVALLAVLAGPANALTCASFEDLAVKSADHDEISRRYFGGWLEGFGGSIIAHTTVSRMARTKETYCLPDDSRFQLTNADLVALYDNVIVTWPNVDKSDPNKCLADAIIMLGLQQKFPCH